MHIELKCVGRAEPHDLAQLLPAIAAAAEEVDLDHSRLAVELEWIQYRKNFRAPVMVRPFGHAGDEYDDAPLAEIAIDVRRAKDMSYDEIVAQIVDRVRKALGVIPDVHECIHLEDWVRPSKSVMWSFNRSYWRHLAGWDETFQKDYAAALPGGVSDGTNPSFWADQIDTFMATLSRLDEWSELPDEIHVLELGVGDGEQSRIWLDTLARACDARGTDYLSRVRYLMADYSPHVLERARQRVAPYADQVSCLELDFRNPSWGLASLRGKVLFAHTCNVYDNLPTDELMRVGNRAYEPLVRASITPGEVARIAADHNLSERDIVAVVQRVLKEGPGSLGSVADGVRFWAAVWDAVHLEEVYAEVPSPSSQRLAPSADVFVDELVEGLPEWRRVHMSTVAVESFAQTLQLLHHEGVLVAQDLFVREVNEYASFRGPGKLEGSVVNWLNAHHFKLVGERLGFRVDVDSFGYRENSNTVVLTARQRDAYRRRSTDELLAPEAAVAHDLPPAAVLA